MLASLVAIATGAQGATIEDTSTSRRIVDESGYAIVVPVNWRVFTDIEGFDFATSTEDALLVCYFMHLARPEMSLSDEAAREYLQNEHLGEAFFRKFFFVPASQPVSFREKELEPKHPSGWPLQWVIGDYVETDGVATRAMIGITFKAKTFFVLRCAAPAAEFERLRPAVQQVFDLFRLFV